jgi:hypothetical protein
MAVFVPDGVGIRNYLYSDVFKGIDAECHLWHAFDERTVEVVLEQVSFPDTYTIPSYAEGKVEKFWRELIHVCRLRYNAKISQNPTILTVWKKRHTGMAKKLFYSIIELLAPLVTSYKGILWMERRYQRKIRTNPFYHKVKAQLRGSKVDTVFCTHQRAVQAAGLFAAASDLGIETISVIYSWDNLPKARLALKADRYLLWSDVMFADMRRFYPEIPDDRLSVVGTPQFEFYGDESLFEDREHFCPANGLDASKRLLCFSGDDELTSPHDPMYLRDLAKGLNDSVHREDFQIVFRRCPVDLSGRYNAVIEEFSDLIVELPPKWNFNRDVWTAVYPLVDDVAILVNLARHCEAVINVGSTMAFDFGMMGKPCIYINYDQEGSDNWSTSTIYRYEHFKSMPSKSVVWWWNTADDLHRLLDLIKDGRGTEIQTWYQLINRKGASRNIQALIQS